MKILIYILVLLSCVCPTFAQLHPAKTGKVLPTFQYQTVYGRTALEQHPQAIVNDISSITSPLSGYHVSYDPSNQLAIMIEGKYLLLGADYAGVYTYLEKIKGALHLKTSKEFNLSQTDTDPITGQVFFRFSQIYNSIPVHGSEWIVVTRNNYVELSMGRMYPTPAAIATIPLLTQEQAAIMANKKLSDITTFQTQTPEQIMIFGENKPVVKLEIYYNDLLQAKLVYHITIRPNLIERYVLVIDANTGETLDQYNHTCSANGPKTATMSDLNNKQRTINTYEYNGSFYAINANETMFNSSQSQFPDDPEGVIWTLDAKNTSGSGIAQIKLSNNTSWSTKTVSAQYNAKVCYDYYKNIHSRNSINGSGGNIISVINVTESSGGEMDNAYWNGQAMFYGNGSVAFKPLAGALDVAGHEMTHGVVEKTANLEYKSQSGAINESMADVFGAMIEGLNWKLGEDVVKAAYFLSGALRDLSNPHNGGNSLNDNGWQPAKMKEYYSGTNDNGGVHINSGIPNHAYYLFATNITKVKAEKVYYRALSKYLTSTSKFLDLRYAVVQSCKDLYGTTEENAAKAAFDAVEIYDPNAGSGGSGNTTGVDLPTNPGTDYIISYDVNYFGTNNRWYKSTTTPSGFQAMTTTYTKQPMSLTDDGSTGYFIGWDSKMHKITVNTFTETIAQNQSIWDNVAISKDGNKIAGVTTSIDSSIWIYDGSNWTRFYLYNPTTGQGQTSAGVLYAGALEWDYTGEYVIYDAYNEIPNNGGSDINYWDVGMIRVWNNKTNKVGNGTIQKVFSSLPSDVSIGNPAISKNSPYIVAFDYIDNSGSNTQYALIASNLITQKVTTVFTNTTLSYPNYSKNDNKILFTTLNTNSDTIIATIDVNTDKITPKAGTAVSFIADAKWGVWIAQGTRKLLSGNKDLLEFKFLGINPQITTNINSTNVAATIPSGVDMSSLVPTFKISPLATAFISATEQVSGATTNNFNNTITYTIQAQDGTTKNYSVKLQQPVGIASLETNDILNLWPNPSTGIVNLNTTPHSQITIYNIMGLQVYQYYTNNSSTTINLSHLPCGVYMINNRTNTGTNNTKLIIER
ncbi:MAG: M4 family metallopeptidase [Bacteroidota bacterium]|nr:M4 family metallopeptidase [Bacteroidota bacterium]